MLKKLLIGKKEIKISTIISIKKEEFCGYNPLACYMGLRKIYGSNNCYILESLEGPSQDVNSAFVGFDKIASINIKKNRLSISGVKSIDNILKNFEANCDYLTADEDDYLIKHGCTWDVLKELHKLFFLEEQTNIGFISFFSYDTAKYIENLPDLIEKENFSTADISLDLYRGLLKFDLNASTITFEQAIVDGIEPIYLKDIVDDFKNVEEPIVKYKIPSPELIVDSCTKSEFVSAAKSCLEHIAAGDIYQIQIGHKLRIKTKVDPLDIYLRLRKINPSPYMYFIPCNNLYVIGASPELFLKKEGNKIEMRPIAGTAYRTKNELVDKKTISKLRNDKKECAEHIMLIDLCRNDLGRICKTGTLNLNKKMIVETYSHLFHLVSSINVILEDDKDIFDAMRATFPAGTMTGAPKIRAMELIETYESSRRNLYAGALGIINLNGNALLALCIRTAIYYAGEYFIRASAGIVADSKPEKEWWETLNKLAATYEAITNTSLKKYYEE